MLSLSQETIVPTFGVRHLSPMAAWQLRQYLDELQPEVVLIEGLDDATVLIEDMVRQGTVPPIAILAYTAQAPVRTLVYPIARYSPEYQALVWAVEHGKRVEFFDLPSDIFLALQKQEEYRSPIHPESQETDAASETDEDDLDSQSQGQTPTASENSDMDDSADFEVESSVYSRLAAAMGEADYESYWERNFEHNLAKHSYRESAFEFGLGIRAAEEAQGNSRRFAESLVREAYMRRRIQETIDAGVAPEKIVAVVGAFHAPALTSDQPTMTDDELASLERLPSKLTLMPYSYFKLSSQSGYGAGNNAPAYYELLWKHIEAEDVHGLAAHYLSAVVRNLRKSGTPRSTAEVIEGVRLARELTVLKDGLAPTLADLQDAATTLMGHGERGVVQEALARVEIGTAIGKLPKGVSQTSIQEDFERQLDQLKLTKYRESVRKELSLDLRENRRAKTEQAAFLDLHRSSFLHRLRLLDVPFAKQQLSRQESTTWKEDWHLQWTPEAEIAIVEAVLLGETIELAASFRFRNLLQECQQVGAAAELIRTACECNMMSAMEQARVRLQALSSETSEFAAIAHAAFELSAVVRYGDVRQYDPEPMKPLIVELFVQGTLGLMGAANCDNEAAKALVIAMDQMNKVALEYHDLVDERDWVGELHRLSDADDRNPKCSGYACAILLERNEMTNEQLGREVARRLSPGIEADLGAGWFEGLASRNRYALLARQVLWEQVGEYVESLDEEQFRRALVFLRRAFGGFSPQEKRAIAENLGEAWGISQDMASELLEQPLSEEEEETLDELNEFDFDDF